MTRLSVGRPPNREHRDDRDQGGRDHSAVPAGSALALLRARTSSSPMVRNTSAQVANQVLSLAVGIVTFALAGRALGAQQYGELATALTMSGLAAVALDGGIDTFVVTKLAASRDADPRSRHARQLVSDAVLARTAVGILAVAAALLVSLLFGYGPTLVLGVLLLSLAALTGAVGTIPLDIYQARRDMIPSTVVGLVGRILSALLVLSLFGAGSLTLVGMYLTVIAGSAATVLATVAWLRTTGFALSLPSVTRARALQWAALPLATWVILGQVVHRADILVLSAVPVGVSTGFTNESAVGIYSAAYKMYDLSIGLPGFLLATLLPTMAALHATDVQGFVRYFSGWTVRAVGLGLVIAVAVALVGGPAVVLLAGSSFTKSATIVPILSLTIPFAYGTTVLYGALVAIDRTRGLVGLYLGAALFNVCLNVLLAPRYAVWSAAWLTVATQVLLLLGMAWMLRRYWRGLAWKHLI